MFFMIRSVIFLTGIVISILGAVLFAQRQEPSAAYFILTQRMAGPQFLSYQLYLPDGRTYRQMPPDFGTPLTWAPDGNGIFNLRDAGLYVYNIALGENRLVVEADMPTIPVGTLPSDYFIFPILVLSPDGSSYLFRADSAVYRFDASGENSKQIFATSGRVGFIVWDYNGESAIMSHTEADEQIFQPVKVNIYDYSQHDTSIYMPLFTNTMTFGVIEVSPTGWRVYPRNSGEGILLDFPEGIFSVVSWLSEELMLVSETDDFGPNASYRLYVMDVYTQELRKIAQPEGAGIPAAAAFKDDSVYTYSAPSPTQQYSALFEAPLDGGEPRVILENCYSAVYFDSESQSARRWQGEPAETIFLATEEQTYRAVYRYDFGDDAAELLFKTDGLTSRGTMDLSPDYRSLIVGNQDLGVRSGYHQRIITVNLEDGRTQEIVQDHAVSAVSPLIDRAVNVEELVMAGILLSGMGLFRRQ
ncbi:MAG: hypothetical protein L0154_14850 [Chloroflexi bacterium]|nr:hypothetical protein [Chloroflexota bacterium]